MFIRVAIISASHYRFVGSSPLLNYSYIQIQKLIFYGKNGIPGVVQELIEEEIEDGETSKVEIDRIEALQITKKRFRERCYNFPEVKYSWN